MNYQNKINRVIEFGHSALEINNSDELRNECMKQLESLFGGSEAVFLNWSNTAESQTRIQSRDLLLSHHGNDFGEMYTQYKTHDPVYRWIRSGDFRCQQHVTRYSQLADFNSIRNTEFYHKVLSPIDCRYVLTMVLSMGDSVIASLSVIRQSCDRDFNDEDLLVAKQLTPIMMSAFRNQIMMSKSETAIELLQLIEKDTVEAPLLVLSNSLQEVYRNDRYSQLESRLKNKKPGISIKNLVEQNPQLTQYIEQFNSDKLAYFYRLPETISGATACCDDLVMEVKLQKHESIHRNKYLLVQFFPKNSQCQPLWQRLTLREQQIAECIAAGLNTQETADKLFISPWSVKNHLKNIYKKVRVNNRLELGLLFKK